MKWFSVVEVLSYIIYVHKVVLCRNRLKALLYSVGQCFALV